MERAIFFVTDEGGNQIDDKYMEETNEFSSFSAAERAARRYSRENPTCIYSVGVAINSIEIRNGRIINRD